MRRELSFGLALLLAACSKQASTPASTEPAASNDAEVTDMLEQVQRVVVHSDETYGLPAEQEERLSQLVDAPLSNYLLVIGSVVSVPPDVQPRALEQGLPLVESEPYMGAQMSLPVEAGQIGAPPCIEPASEQEESWAAEFLEAASVSTLEDPPAQAIDLDRQLRRVRWQGLVFGCESSLDRLYVGVSGERLVFLSLPRNHAGPEYR